MQRLSELFRANSKKDLVQDLDALDSVLGELPPDPPLGAAVPEEPPRAECVPGFIETLSANADQQSEVSFQGFDGATSLKAEISGRIPSLNDASAYREARCLLLKSGGADALMHELIFSGFVDPDTGLLSLAERPFNVFAHLAAGRMVQPGMEREQEALGDYGRKFHICANQLQNDLHWDSQDPRWIPKASMGRRHRFLTTKNLHWQWFNPLTFGLVPPEEGGVVPRDALLEVEEMKAAALHYARHVGGWSGSVGLFVNVFGHNNVNSLFVHVLDMAELGPGFEHHARKNCPLDEVLKVLREEAVRNLLPSPPKPIVLVPGCRKSRSAFFFAGTDGATSLKEEIVARLPHLRDASGYRDARKLLEEELGGCQALLEELQRSGIVDTERNELTSNTLPFNVFARIAAGKMHQAGQEAEQEFLGTYRDRFIVCSNRPENDVHWDSEDAEWVGKASMSRRHKFLIMKDLHWQWFNALVFGMVPANQGGVGTRAALAVVELMKAAALTYTSNRGDWSSQVGLFFHIFGHNSVNALHLHIVDMSELGPSFWKLDKKNCPLDAVLTVLKEEIARADYNDVSQQTARAVVEAAASAKETMLSVKKMVNRHSPGPSPSYILQLNVGGDLVDVHRDTMLLAPPGSMLREMFDVGWTGPPLQQDVSGRIFLDFPPASFRTIVNHLRLLRNMSPAERIPPPVVQKQDQREFEELAWLLGVGDLVCQPQPGRADGVPARVGPRPRAVTRQPHGCVCA